MITKTFLYKTSCYFVSFFIFFSSFAVALSDQYLKPVKKQIKLFDFPYDDANYSEPISKLQKLSQKNSSRAQYSLGMMYAMGMYVKEINPQLALQLMQHSVKNGNSLAMYQLAVWLYDGDMSLEKDIEASVKLMKQSSQYVYRAKYQFAMHMLTEKYWFKTEAYTGKMNFNNMEEAIKLLEQAEKQGNLAALMQLRYIKTVYSQTEINLSEDYSAAKRALKPKVILKPKVTLKPKVILKPKTDKKKITKPADKKKITKPADKKKITKQAKKKITKQAKKKITKPADKKCKALFLKK